ncbi:MAG: agmatine deiminase family protein [Planctomycetota bacterium]
MQRALGVVFVLSLAMCFAGQAIAAAPAQAPPPALDDESSSLPRYMTEEEKLLPLPSVTREDYLGRTPPIGTVRCPAEYEHQEGLFIAWEGYTTLLTSMVVGITANDPDAIVYVVVDTTLEQTTAYNTLSSSGADMSQVVFILRTTDTVWIRDYGPRFIFEDADRAIIDHVYNRPRPNDDALNDYISTLWGETQYDIPLYHGGGNFHLFSNGEAFMTGLILEENPSRTEQDIKDLYRDYQNLDLTIYPPFRDVYDSTNHIDMWMFPVDDHTVIIGQYPSGATVEYNITENAAADLAARGYTVYRTPGWNSGGTGGGGTHYTYTNAVVINDRVFISRFGGSYTSQDAQALSVFQTAFPGKTITQLDSASIITAAGAMHCIVMHVPVLGLTVTPIGEQASEGPEGGPFTPDSVDYLLANTSDSAIGYNVTTAPPG